MRELIAQKGLRSPEGILLGGTPRIGTAIASPRWAARYSARRGKEARHMKQLRMADELARRLCRQLYEFTDGWPVEWRRAVGADSLHTAVEHAVENGWLLFDVRDSSICLTDEDRRFVRKTLS